jgi:L-serine dehydratase
MSKKSSDNNDNVFPEFSAELNLPENIDRRTFLIRNAVIGAAAAMTGTVWTTEARAQQAAKEAAEKSPLPPLDSTSMSPELDVVKRSKGPVMTVLDEFYKVGPGPSSSHTIGPMRITYDFYQRCTKLPADQLKQATGLKVHLYGSLSATGKGHGTERAALAGLIGKEPATVDPLFLDEMKEKPDQSYPLKLGDKTFNLSLADIIYDTPKGDFPHPNTMTCKLMGGDKSVYELEYYSPGGGFYEWKGYTPPKKGQPKYPYGTMKELRQHAEKNNLSIAQVIMANEIAVSGKTEEQINAFLDKISAAMLATVKAGLAVKEGLLPGPIKLHSKAATVWQRAQDDKYEADRAVALLSACALAASEENARGHLVITAPTGGSAGVMPAIVYALTETKRKLPQDKVRQGLLGGAAIGYLCKHNATLSLLRRWTRHLW